MIIVGSITTYLLQQNIFWTSIGFTDVATNSSDPALKMLSAFLNDDKKSNKAAEILNYRDSMDFTKKVSKSLIFNPHFDSLRFDLSFFDKTSLSAKSIAKECKNDKFCIEKELSEKLPKFYEVLDRDRGGTNFLLQVKATDELTANILLSEIMKAIQASRVESLKTNIAQQENVNIDILGKKKKELESVDYYKLIEDKIKMENDLKTIDSNIDYQTKLSSEIQLNLARAESKFRRVQKISKKKVGRDELELERKSIDLRDKIEKLTSDIHSLENMNSDATEKDKSIIMLLKKELAQNKKQLERLDVGGSYSAFDKFVKSNEEKVGANELDYRVLHDQLVASNQNIEILSLKKKTMFAKKAQIDETLDKLKPSIEFLKTLEAKIEQLRLLRTTSVSDMRFDVYAIPTDSEGVKKIGKLLMTAYTIVLLALLNIVLLTVLYWRDDRIYDEADLKIISENLKVIGIGSHYDS